jgi:hypothetical protein
MDASVWLLIRNRLWFKDFTYETGYVTLFRVTLKRADDLMPRKKKTTNQLSFDFDAPRPETSKPTSRLHMVGVIKKESKTIVIKPTDKSPQQG